MKLNDFFYHTKENKIPTPSYFRSHLGSRLDTGHELHGFLRSFSPNRNSRNVVVEFGHRLHSLQKIVNFYSKLQNF